MLFLNFREFSVSFVLIYFFEKSIHTVSILLGKKLRCVKVLSSVEAVKAKESSRKILKIWLIFCDIRHCIINLDGVIFEFGYIVFLVISFMLRLAFLIWF